MRVWKKIPNCWRCDFFNSAQSRVLSGENVHLYDGSASGALYLNTPRQITDASGNVVWQWDNSDPFGNNVPNENPSGLGIFTCNLGFPGQYRDRETSAFYNFYRDAYDSATGRYTQFDPIGLRGGINGFVYVGGNPISKVDPKGLLEQCRTGLDKLGGYGTSTPLHHEYSCWTKVDGTRICRGFGRDPDSSVVDAMINKVPGKVLKDKENPSHGKEQCTPDDKNECMNKCVDDFYQGLENDTPVYSWTRDAATQCQDLNRSIITTCSQYCASKK